MNQNIVYSNPFIIIFIIGTILSFLINHILEFVDYKYRVKNGGKLPEQLKEIPSSSVFDEEKLSKISKYENAKYFFWIPKSICSLALDLILVCKGFYPWLLNITARITGTPYSFGSMYFCAFLFLLFVSIPENLLSIPFDLYREFRIEKKFGFSKMTFKLWILDNLKGIVVSLLLSAILLLPVTGIMIKFPSTWWILITCVLIGFTLIMQIVYPLFIAPIFNKFTPLEDGELKTKITSLMKDIGFKQNGIFVMDASKRSGHSNAYFTGFGKSKRIVLYDTLINQLNTDELTAVLGHELGHYKLKHIFKRICVLLPVEFILMYILYRFANTNTIYTGFGFAISDGNVQSFQLLGLFLASLVWSSIEEIISPVVNISSRRDEYQADEYSAKMTKNPDALISGLIKLNSENLSELLPPRIYVFWNYSHPTLIERIEALKKVDVKS